MLSGKFAPSRPPFLACRSGPPKRSPKLSPGDSPFLWIIGKTDGDHRLSPGVQVGSGTCTDANSRYFTDDIRCKHFRESKRDPPVPDRRGSARNAPKKQKAGRSGPALETKLLRPARPGPPAYFPPKNVRWANEGSADMSASTMTSTGVLEAALIHSAVMRTAPWQ